MLRLLLALLAPAFQEAPRSSIALDSWEFRVEDAPDDSWRPVSVPAPFEEAAGLGFDGVGLYRLRLAPPPIPDGHRVYLRFDAAATRATVSVDGQEVGRHLGGWTPFRVDVTDRVAGKESVEVGVRVDELVGHNTQGFLPIFQPHFGGLWQKATLEVLPPAHFDDLRVLAVGDLATRKVLIEAPIIGAADSPVSLRYRRLGDADWSPAIDAVAEGDTLRADLPVIDPSPWSPASPALYELNLRLPASGDEITTRFAFRSIETSGRSLLLNGRPVQVRGVLNWGYYPPRLAPVPDEDRFLRDIQYAKMCGFNLMKFCLWIPPKRYLDLCDENGLLAWVEYPTWHPKLDATHRADLEAEFAEFFAFDRDHPSVILRSLTCETGPSSDLAVIQSLYDRCKAMIPGAIVEDDSSWIEWQRVFDFHDDHPYGNNHTWPSTLARLNRYIGGHGGKPLVLGEAIAADTWPDLARLSARVGQDRPYWLPGFFDAALAWADRMRSLYGPAGLDDLAPDSLRYAARMRKYQMEAYRREVPQGGYVVSVLRDFPFAAMGLLDYLDHPKWIEPNLSLSQRDTQLVLSTPSDRRALCPGSGTPFPASVHASHFGDPSLRLLQLRHAAPLPGHEPFADPPARVALAHGDLKRDLLTLDLDQAPPADTPRRSLIAARLQADASSPPVSENSWPLWLLPRPSTPEVLLHPSVDPTTASLFPSGRPLADTDLADGPPIVARRFDARLIALLDAGARVLFLPDGQPGSFATADHWFLRGAPYLPAHPLLSRVPRDLLVDLQAFDLAGPVLPRVDAYLDQIDPILLLWDNHDLKEVRTHALAFETSFGPGRLMVSVLAHGPESNAAGRWLLGEFLAHLASGPAPKHALSASTIEHIRTKSRSRSLDLSSQPWRFRPDPGNDGLSRRWHDPATPAAEGWTDLRIDRHWDSQGFETLDGWAWYRLTVDVPADWAGEELYVSFRGVDDAYFLYANGHPAGEGGDIATKRTAFEDRTSHRITDFARPGRPLTLAVRVFDWYGAGGIFRPVSLATTPLAPEPDWLR